MDYKRTLSNYLGHRTDPAKVAVALLAGLAVGAILGVLFAPETGEDIRYRISDKAKGLANDAKDKFQSVRNRFRTNLDDLNDTKDQAVKTVRAKTKNAVADTKEYAGNTTQAIKTKAKNVSVDQNGSIQGI